jgi:hypothetical protein
MTGKQLKKYLGKKIKKPEKGIIIGTCKEPSNNASHGHYDIIYVATDVILDCLGSKDIKGHSAYNFIENYDTNLDYNYVDLKHIVLDEKYVPNTTLMRKLYPKAREVNGMLKVE